MRFSIVVVLSYFFGPHVTKVHPAESACFNVVAYNLNISLRRCFCIADTEVFCALLSFVLEAVSYVRSLGAHSAVVTRHPHTFAS